MPAATAEEEIKLLWVLLSQKFTKGTLTGISWQRVADNLGLASPSTAATRWAVLKKKLDSVDASGGNGKGKGKGAKKTRGGGKRKREENDVEEGEDEGEGGDVGAKAKKGRGRLPKVKKEKIDVGAEPEDGGDGEGAGGADGMDGSGGRTMSSQGLDNDEGDDWVYGGV